MRAGGPEHVARHLHKRVEHVAKVGVDLADGRGERTLLVAADLDALEPLELHDRLAEVEQVMAALQEGVETREERRVLDAPRVLRHLVVGSALVVKVYGLEGATHLERDHEPLHGLLRLNLEELLRRDEGARLRDQVVADLAHEHHEARGRVVVL